MVVHIDTSHGGQLRCHSHQECQEERQTARHLYRIRPGGEKAINSLTQWGLSNCQEVLSKSIVTKYSLTYLWSVYHLGFMRVRCGHSAIFLRYHRSSASLSSLDYKLTHTSTILTRVLPVGGAGFDGGRIRRDRPRSTLLQQGSCRRALSQFVPRDEPAGSHHAQERRRGVHMDGERGVHAGLLPRPRTRCSRRLLNGDPLASRPWVRGEVLGDWWPRLKRKTQTRHKTNLKLSICTYFDASTARHRGILPTC